MNAWLATSEQRWLSRPLCCQYLLVHFEVLPVQVWIDRAEVHEQTLGWSLGVLADGQCELLGAWLEPEAGATGWQEVFEDLQVRGVEKVRFVVANERSEVRAGVPTAYSAATVLPSTWNLLGQSLAQVAPRHRKVGGDALGAISSAGTAQAARAVATKLGASPWGERYPAVVERLRNAVDDLGPFYALGTRLRRLVRTGDEAAQRVAETLQRAVARHGCFSSEEAAITFVSEVLDRANRRFGSAGPLAGRGTQSRVLRLGDRSAPAGCH